MSIFFIEKTYDFEGKKIINQCPFLVLQVYTYLMSLSRRLTSKYYNLINQKDKTLKI